MRTLTNLEITATAGGIVIPLEPFNEREAFVVAGMLTGFLGGLGGLVLGLQQSNYGLQGIALSAVAGFAVGAFGIPLVFTGFVRVMEYSYEKMGLI